MIFSLKTSFSELRVFLSSIHQYNYFISQCSKDVNKNYKFRTAPVKFLPNIQFQNGLKFYHAARIKAICYTLALVKFNLTIFNTNKEF